MSKTIYAVTAGCYSDYRVVALFSSKELAKEFMDAIPDDYYNPVEKFELNPPTADLIARGYSVWNVHMLRGGDTERVERTENGLYNVRGIGHSIWRRSKAPAYKGSGKQDCLISSVWAKTEKQAVKIANEHRTQMIANGQW